jgi:hypothetical protein
MAQGNIPYNILLRHVTRDGLDMPGSPIQISAAPHVSFGDMMRQICRERRLGDYNDYDYVSGTTMLHEYMVSEELHISDFHIPLGGIMNITMQKKLIRDSF